MNFKDQQKTELKIYLFILVVCMVAVVCFSGCKSFKPQVDPNDTPDCKDFYYVMEYYSVQGGDSAFIGTVYGNCKASRTDKKNKLISKQQKKIEELCGKMYSDKDEYAKCTK